MRGKTVAFALDGRDNQKMRLELEEFWILRLLMGGTQLSRAEEVGMVTRDTVKANS